MLVPPAGVPEPVRPDRAESPVIKHHSQAAGTIEAGPTTTSPVLPLSDSIEEAPGGRAALHQGLDDLDWAAGNRESKSAAPRSGSRLPAEVTVVEVPVELPPVDLRSARPYFNQPQAISDPEQLTGSRLSAESPGVASPVIRFAENHDDVAELGRNSDSSYSAHEPVPAPDRDRLRFADSPIDRPGLVPPAPETIREVEVLRVLREKESPTAPRQRGSVRIDNVQVKVNLPAPTPRLMPVRNEVLRSAGDVAVPSDGEAPGFSIDPWAGALGLSD
jgi:hypothetical protein